MTEPARLDLVEHTTSVHPLPSPVVAELVRLRAVDAVPTTGGWQLRTRARVGVLRIADHEVHIRPKLDVSRLLFLLLYADDPRGWREDTVGAATSDDLLELLARTFTAAAERALRHGPLRGYVTRDATSAVLRGRLRVGDQLAARGGFPVPAEITYDEYTPDIAENQVPAAAIRRLRHSPLLPTDLTAQLARLERALTDVTAHPVGVAVPPLRFDRLNAHYRTAYELATLLLRDGHLDLGHGEQRSAGMLFDMDRVFERFVTRACREHTPEELRLDSQHVTSLDVERQLQLRPDLTWWAAGRVVAVGDAKYKDLRDRSVPPGDLYQLLTYATVHGLAEAHLVYAAGADGATRYTVRRSGVQLHVHRLDLGAEPAGIVEQLADTVATIVHPV